MKSSLTRSVLFSTALLFAFASAACSSASTAASPQPDAGASPDGQTSVPDAEAASETDAADASADAPFAPAPHQVPPTVIKANGALLTSPKIVTVTFASDPLTAQVEALAQSIGSNAYWNATTAEYGIQPVQFARAVHVTPAPATTLQDTDVEAYLVSQLDGTHAEWGTPDANTIYSLVYPVGTKIISGGQSSPAYHGEVKLASNVVVPYAVVARKDPFLGLSGIDYVTAALSHEWVEAATNPFPTSAPAYAEPPEKYATWAIVTGGELADMCTLTTAVYEKPTGLPFTVQRSWSNASVLAGHDPCVPALATPYFNAAPRLPDMLNGTYYGQAFRSEGVKIPKGQSKTVDVDLFSDRPLDGPWKVEAFDFGQMSGAATTLGFAWDKTEGANGDRLHLTITRIKDAPNLAGVDPFIIVSVLGNQRNAWVGAAGD